MEKDWLLRGFSTNYKIDIEHLAFDQIYSIEFIHSLCFIKKKPMQNNKLGKRTVVGKDAIVVTDRTKLNNQDSQSLNQNTNPWSNNDLLSEEELALYKKKIKSFDYEK